MKFNRYSRFSLLIAILFCCIGGCDSENSSCPQTAYCNGNTRFYCQNDVLQSQPCQDNEICANGVCQAQDKCNDANFTGLCDGNIAINCVDGHLVKTTCDPTTTCQKGKCASECDETSILYCKNAQTAVICMNGSWAEQSCPENKVCSAGACLEKSSDCGNGKLDKGEKCDDGDKNGTYGNCSADCKTIMKCGNGIQEPPENCDDGDYNGIYSKCRADCSGVANCGDSIHDENDEKCDDGNNNGLYGFCSTDCKYKIECGNGKLEGEEVCDDGKKNGQPGKCRSNCTGPMSCGDGVVDPVSETCDPPSDGYLKACDLTCHRTETLFEEYPSVNNHQYSTSCNETDMWGKYFAYRARFLGNAKLHIPGFIDWGTEPGQSLPAAFRDPTTNCAKTWALNHDKVQCEFEDLPDAEGYYNWGDTSLWLGIMVHWLTLEHRVFDTLGMDTRETEKYLYMAIKAFDRIDLVAETFFELEPKLDGFFIRDDLPRDFYLKNGSYRFERRDGANKGYECAVSTNACERYQKVPAADLLKTGTFVSQDQITGLFEGFGAMAVLMPEDAVYEGINLKKAAQEIINRNVMYMKSHNWSLGIQLKSGWLQIPDEWGGFAQMFSGMFAEAANMIAAPDFGTENYHDILSEASLTLAKKGMDTFWLLWENVNNYNRNLVLRILNFTDIWDNQTFLKNSVESGRDVFALSHALIHDIPVNGDIPLWRFHSVLASAPCAGPCSGTTCKNPVPGWMGEGYFLSPHDRFGSKFNSGEYNGLDYMIAHNLYFLAYAQKTGRPYTQILPAATSAKGTLKRIIEGEKAPETYNIKDSSNAADLSMTFCGRHFADWLRDNALGLSDIYTGNIRWSCTIEGTCTLSEDKTPYTHNHSLIIGTNNADTLDIKAGYHHCVATLGGNDNISIGAGYHVIESGDGDDTIKTNGTNVSIFAGDGNDNIQLGSGFHMVDAGAGNDTVTGGNGTNLIYGGDGDDVINAQSGSNRILGGPGNDTISGNDGSNTVWGNEGNDKIRLGNGDNLIWPGDGDAFILLGNGDNKVTVEEPQDDNIYICFGSGKNTIWAGWSSTSHCSATQNSSTADSCVPDLTSEFCSLNNYNSWKF